MTRKANLALSVALTLPAGVSGGTSAVADSIDVDCLGETHEEGCSTTLREAVIQANANAGDDTVFLPAGIYALTLSGSDDDVSALGDLDITDVQGTLFLVGTGGAAVTILDASGLRDRVLEVHDGATANLSGVTLQGGGYAYFVDGGGLFNAGTTTIVDSTIRANLGALGGGIFNADTGILSLIGTNVLDNTLFDNKTGFFGGGLWNAGTGDVGRFAGGGSFNTNTEALSPTRTNLRDNMARSSRGVFIQASTIHDNRALFRVDGGPSFFFGGGLWNAGTTTIVDSTILGNVAGSASAGGGIFSTNTGTLSLTRTTVRNNMAGSGGGVFSRGETSIEASAIHENQALLGVGGGISSPSPAVLTIRTSTISGNIAEQRGGGIDVAGTFELHSTTITNNIALEDGGGIRVNGGSGSADNTLISGNVGGDCVTEEGGDLNLLGRNLIQDITGCLPSGNTAGLVSGVDPLLGTLQANGGSTETHAVLPGSPAVDAGECGPPIECGEPPTEADQRGVERPVDLATRPNAADACDIGAFEYTCQDNADLGGITIPVRWCVLEGSPSLTDLPPDQTINDVLADYHGRVGDNVLFPEIDIGFQSAATPKVPGFPVLDDPPGPGQTGDVFIDVDKGDFTEFVSLINRCRVQWAAEDAEIGVTSVLIGRFVDVDDSGTVHPLNLVGLAGRAAPGDCATQLTSGRLMVVDRGAMVASLTLGAEALDKILGHELGHTFSLPHGNGVDDDGDCLLDEPDDDLGSCPVLGPNLMQYDIPTAENPQAGTELTLDQGCQGREHVMECIPGRVAAGLPPLVADLEIDEVDLAAIDEGRINILDFGIVLNPDGTSTVFASTAAPLEAGKPPVQYDFKADLNNDGTFDFAAGVTVDSDLVATPSDPSIEARLQPVELGLTQVPSPPSVCPPLLDIEVGTSIQLVIPNALLVTAGWTVGEPFEMTVNTTLAGKAIDEATGCLLGFDDPSGTFPCLPSAAPVLSACEISPPDAGAGAGVTLDAQGLPPLSEVNVYVHGEVLATASTDETGHAVVPLTVPVDAQGGPLFFSARPPETAIECRCAVAVSNAAPVALCQDVTVPVDPGQCSASTASIDAGSSDPDGGPLTLEQSPPPPYDLGTTLVTLLVEDESGASATCQASVTVTDPIDPSLTVKVVPAVLWPPNHKMVDVKALVSPDDNCGVSSVVLTSITSDEPDPGKDDIQGAAFGTPDFDFKLRGERDGKGNGRVYTIVYSGMDASGNAASASALVLVPHDQGNNKTKH